MIGIVSSGVWKDQINGIHSRKIMKFKVATDEHRVTFST